MRSLLVVLGAVIAGTVLAGSRVQSVAGQDAADKPPYYTERVRPVLVKNCAECHMGNNARGGLNMETKVDFLAGAKGLKVIVPGNPAESPLVRVIRHNDTGHQIMPPEGPGLSEGEIALVTNWVKAGAIMPDDPPGTVARSQAPGNGRGMGGNERPQTMDIASGKKMVNAIEAEAARLQQHVAICVMDTNGDIVAFERMDGADRIPLSTAEGKARAVLLFGLPTGVIADAAQSNSPVTATITPAPIGIGGGSGITLMRGGLPIYKNGKMVGSIGVGGSASEEDEHFSQIGINAAGLDSKK